MNNCSLSVIIPVYNSAGTIAALLARLIATLESLNQPYEIILVNDGSKDLSWDQILASTRTHSHVRGINLMRNYGQHNALLCGMRAAKNDVTVTMDDDLQNPPEELPILLAKLAEGYDLVYGTPVREQHGIWRNLASQITKQVLQSSMGAETARSISAFRAFRSDLRNAFAAFQSPYVSIDVLLTWGTSRIAAVPVRHESRQIGDSNYTLRKLLTHALNMTTGFSVWPLQLASLIGFAFTLFGIGVLLYVLGRYFVQGDSVAGFPFLASVVALFSGAQLFALGIIGEYLARIHFRMMERPTYTVREYAHTADEVTDDGH